MFTVKLHVHKSYLYCIIFALSQALVTDAVMHGYSLYNNSHRRHFDVLVDYKMLKQTDLQGCVVKKLRTKKLVERRQFNVNAIGTTTDCIK